ncbi:NAD(P)-binding oxidoreductase [Hydrogenophaga sp.]|uniref:NAD(P)-binding oxidoreductase n=1 Tax=Hydrogenophaga sp. TaxID=1904254 RepID=UPI0027171B5E|nr:NAD(P)-binding oxidoreductase [Hydrogenophaga sp.]MDO8905499.1 SDR family oxidoreductase [Hydrogenophaga sp.]
MRQLVRYSTAGTPTSAVKRCANTQRDMFAACASDATVQSFDGSLGIRENPWRVRLLGSVHTPMDVRSQGARHVIEAMHRHGMRRLVVQTSDGVGATLGRLPFMVKLAFALMLRPQIRDTGRQEDAVRNSGLDWVLVQPVNLTDEAVAEPAFASTEGDFRSMKVSRQQVGEFLADAVLSDRYVGASVALRPMPANAMLPPPEPQAIDHRRADSPPSWCGLPFCSPTPFRFSMSRLRSGMGLPDQRRLLAHWCAVQFRHGRDFNKQGSIHHAQGDTEEW